MASEKIPIASSKLTDPGEALSAGNDGKQQELEATSNRLRDEIEALARQVRDLILAEPPVPLLAYVWGQFILEAMRHQENEDARPNSRSIDRFQFVLEYLHAIWSTHAGTFNGGALDEEKAGTLFSKCDELRTKTIVQCMASSAASKNKDFGPESSSIEFKAKSAWVSIRGNRYQVLEKEFFRFVLKPHDAALRKAYGIDSEAIADGVQAAADAIRTGHDSAIRTLEKRMSESSALVETEGISLDDAIKKLTDQDPTCAADVEGAMRDLLFGGVCNLSRHTTLPKTLLEDLAYEPGAEVSFFAEGQYAGTPLRTIPARVRPLIKLDDEYYATDGQFVRDSAYRAI